MEVKDMPNIKAVSTFLGLNATRVVTTPELAEFWKALTLDERQQLGDESRSLLAAV